MPNYCIVKSWADKNERYPTSEEIDSLGVNIPKFINKCKSCSKYLSGNCEKICIYKE